MDIVYHFEMVQIHEQQGSWWIAKKPPCKTPLYQRHSMAIQCSCQRVLQGNFFKGSAFRSHTEHRAKQGTQRPKKPLADALEIVFMVRINHKNAAAFRFRRSKRYRQNTADAMLLCHFAPWGKQGPFRYGEGLRLFAVQNPKDWPKLRYQIALDEQLMRVA